MNFVQFKNKHQLKNSELYSEFFDLFIDSIDIKNKSIAVEKLQTIIKATFKLSSSQSFANMSLRQLSDETKISMGGLYAYIKSKQQLSLYIHQFLNHYADKVMNEVDTSDTKNTLENLIRTHVYLSEIMHPWFFFAFMESKNLNKEQKRYAIQSELMMEKKLKDAISKGQDFEIYKTSLSPETIAAHIKPLLHDWYLKRWKYKQRKTNIEDFCFSVMLFINNGLTIPK
jgi:AcrR family transcriptional regulator